MRPILFSLTVLVLTSLPSRACDCGAASVLGYSAPAVYYQPAPALQFYQAPAFASPYYAPTLQLGVPLGYTAPLGYAAPLAVQSYSMPLAVSSYGYSAPLAVSSYSAVRFRSIAPEIRLRVRGARVIIR